MVELHPAVQAAADALAEHVEDVWEKPPDDEQREDLAATAALAVPAVLRWAAERIRHQADRVDQAADVALQRLTDRGRSGDVKVARVTPARRSAEALRAAAGDLDEQAAEVERDTRGGDRG